MADWELKGKVALLVLDMQEDIVGEGGKGEPLGFPKACKEAGIIPRIQALPKAFREKKLPVVHVGAVQATDQGYSVIVPKDAVTSSDKEAHEFSLTKVLPLVSLITTTQGVLSEI